MLLGIPLWKWCIKSISLEPRVGCAGDDLHSSSTLLHWRIPKSMQLVFLETVGFLRSPMAHWWLTKSRPHGRFPSLRLWSRAQLNCPSLLLLNQPWIFTDGLLLKLKFQYFGHLMRRANSSEKTLMLGKIERKRRGQQRVRWLDSITDSMDKNLSKLQELVKDRGVWHIAVHVVTKSWTWLSNWRATWLIRTDAQ